ncbi:PIN domain-containing protein [Candidatus Poriferisodalis sp.]|uniref:PIN domain-containing protein n=1 Tax=Candidatus Poriferisodalis sp. TaxID=3101277 RepID=UPI003B58D7E8
MNAATVLLIDTNILVYRVDSRFPDKQQISTEHMRAGIEARNAYIAHQSVIEFVAATTRDGPERRLLDFAEAAREAEELMTQFPIIYPDAAVVRTALRGAAAYGMSWFDAHLWAYAEVNGITGLLSEDFEHGRLYGTVRVTNPFAVADQTAGDSS